MSSSTSVNEVNSQENGSVRLLSLWMGDTLLLLVQHLQSLQTEGVVELKIGATARCESSLLSDNETRKVGGAGRGQ
jgi:hypothetical protein